MGTTSVEYNLSHATIEKYGAYARAIDILAEKAEVLVLGILSGKIKIAHENVIELSRLSAQKLKLLHKKTIKDDRYFVGYTNSRKKFNNHSKLPETSVKNIPKYDPDAEVSSLVLTVPSWVSLIDKTCLASDLSQVTENAKIRLLTTLNNLQKSINNMINNLR